MRAVLLVWVSICLYLPNLTAQEPPGLVTKLPDGFLISVHKQTSTVNNKLSRANEKALRKWSWQERKLLKRIKRADSTAAAQLKTELDKKSQQLSKQLADTALTSRQYFPSLDTLKTSLKFLSANPEMLSAQNPGNPLQLSRMMPESLGRSFGQSEKINTFMREKQELLRGKLNAIGLTSRLKSINKTAYYYKAQVDEYKAMLKDHKKMVRRGLDMLQKTKAFQEFMQRNSQLASLFGAPGRDAGQSANIAGLQTRTQVNTLIQQQVGAAGPGGAAQFRSNLSQAQNELNALKDKVMKLSGGSSDLAMPDGFKPNPYKTKSFLQRIEFGANIQSQRSRGWLPARSDLGISLGYKFRPNVIAGIGGSYRLGWGRDIRRMKISHQGLSFRSFVEAKLNGSFWLTGGYEQNQIQENDVDGNNTTSWRWIESGLIGISKVVSLQSSFLKKTKMMLLWDFLSYKHGKSSPIVFRIGYSF